MKRCDLCGKEAALLTDLRDIYKTELIAEVCIDCESEANKHLRKLQAAVGKIQRGWMKRWLTNTRNRLIGGEHD